MNETASTTSAIGRPDPAACSQPRTIPGPSDCEVLAYPSTGGIVIGQLLRCHGPRPIHKHKPSPTTVQSRPRKTEQTTMKKKTPSHDDLTYPYGYHFPPDLHVAYSPSDSPKQAVLVLKTFPDTSDYRIAEDAPYKPNDYSRLAACKTMEEGWDVLRHFSATEYDDARMCPDIPQSLEEGFAEGRQYGELLKKMQDPGYLDQWLMSL